MQREFLETLFQKKVTNYDSFRKNKLGWTWNK